MNKFALKKIVWALDAFEDPEWAIPVRTFLNALAHQTQASIQPVFVLSRTDSRLPAVSFPKVSEAFRALAEKNMAAMIRFSEVKMEVPFVLVSQDDSRRKDISLLTDYCHLRDVDAIVTATHGRQGLSRAIIGSFTEALAVQSSVPLITVNPESHASSKIQRVIFPSDFHTRYRGAFEKVAGLVKSLNAKLVLYYKEEHWEGTFMRKEVRQYLKEESDRRYEAAMKWRDWSLAQGIETTLALDRETGPIVSRLNDYVLRNDIDLIAVATKADEFSAAILGSVSRQLIRHAPCPVWTLRGD